jgi:hypothetical protein
MGRDRPLRAEPISLKDAEVHRGVADINRENHLLAHSSWLIVSAVDSTFVHHPPAKEAHG